MKSATASATYAAMGAATHDVESWWLEDMMNNDMSSQDPSSSAAATSAAPNSTAAVGANLFDILSQVEQVLEEQPFSFPTEESNIDGAAMIGIFDTDPLLGPNHQDQQDGGDIVIEPTPIGTASIKGAIRVVDHVNVTETKCLAGTEDECDTYLSLLKPLLLHPSSSSSHYSRMRLPKLNLHGGVDEVAADMSNSNKRRKLENDRYTTTTETLSNDASKTTETSSPPQPSTSTTTTDDAASSSNASDKNRFRLYQAEQWMDRFHDLIQFKELNGHCLVPHSFPSNPQLAQWVKRQRYQYKLKAQGKHSTLSNERQVELTKLGFVWDSHKVAWEEKFLELVQYMTMKKQLRRQTDNGVGVVSPMIATSSSSSLATTTTVTTNTTVTMSTSLSVWMKCQRRQYKLFCKGQSSNMTQERVDKLNSIGFVWSPRVGGK